MKNTLFVFIGLLFLFFSCAGEKHISIVSSETPEFKINKNYWKLKITRVDVSHYPEIKLSGVVTDSSNTVIKNLAPPFGHLKDWQRIWQPILQRHPIWGEKEYEDFAVYETQHEAIDTTSLAKLQNEKTKIEQQIQSGRQAFQNVIERVQNRKNQLTRAQRETLAKTSVVLVMDVSGSMSGEPLSKAKMAAAEFLEFSDAEIAVLAFSDIVYEITGFSRDRNRLTTAVMSLATVGGTQLYDALYHAINMLQNRSGEKHIIALTDGATAGDQYSLQQIINFANSGDVSVTAKTGDHTKLFTIGLGYAGTNLQEMAQRTGGKYYFVTSPDEILDLFSDYIGFKLEQTRPEENISMQLRWVNTEIERIYGDVVKDYHYDIVFTSQFPIEDGLDFKVSFKLFDRIFWQTIKIPVSKKELAARGYVIDLETKEGLPGGIVTINPQKMDTTYSVKADSSGYFELKVVRTNNKYTLFAQAEDYFISAKEYRLARPDSFYVTVVLKLKKARQGVKAVMRTIHFENNEFLFEPVSFSDLVSMGNYLVQHPEYKFEVAGHTDSYGKASYNLWLSERRAEAVADFFIGMGVPEDNVVIKGYGESKLLYPDTSEENRYMNRRVEIKLVGMNKDRIAVK